MCLMVGLLLAMVLCADSPRKAAEYMKLGQYDDAMRVYEDLASRKPDDSRYLYNAGVAAYKAQKFQEAQEYFDASSLSSDLGLQQQSFYNRGNALYKSGENEAEFEKKTQLWKEALDQFDHAVKLNDTDKLATENLQFVKTQLENLQQQQQQEQENQPDEDQNEDDKQNDQKDQDKQQQNDQQQNDQNDQQQDGQEDSSEGNDQDPSSEEDQEDLKKGNQDQENPEKPEEQEQKQPSKSDENQEEEEASAGQPEEGKGNETETAATTMTPQQAMQLLESAKDEAKALIFKPRENKRNQRFKDW